MLGLSPEGIHLPILPLTGWAVTFAYLVPRLLFFCFCLGNCFHRNGENRQEWPSDRSSVTNQHFGTSFVSWIPTKHERSSDMLMKFLEGSNHMLLSKSKPKLIAYGSVAPRRKRKGKTKLYIESEEKSFHDWKAVTSLEARISQEKRYLFLFLSLKYNWNFNIKFQIYCCVFTYYSTTKTTY